MSTWRRLAEDQFPELKTDALCPVETLHDLYSELSRFLDRALDANDSACVQRILSFALWGVGQTKNEQFIHCTVDLFWRIVRSESKRIALWRHLTASQFSIFKGYFIEAMDSKSQITAKDLEQEYRLTPRLDA